MNSFKNILLFTVLCSLFLVACNGTPEDNSGTNSELIAMVMLKDKYGYINTNGDYVITPQYDLARTFSNGVACINIGGQRNGLVEGVVGGKYQFINTKNEIQFNAFSSSSPMTFYNNVAVVIEDDESKSLLTSTGEKVASKYTVLGDCEEGLIPAFIEKEKKLGFINPKGDWVTELPYKYFIGPYSEGLSAFTDSDTKLCGYFDTKGKKAIPASYQLANNFSEGVACIRKGGVYQFIDKTAKLIFDQQFEYATDFHEGLSAVQQMGKWGFINMKGELVIDYKDVLGVRESSEGLIAFKEKEGKVGYMNAKGKVIIPAQFDNGLNFTNGYAIIEKDGKMGFINKKGDIVIEPKYQRVGNFVDPNVSNKIVKVN